MLTILDSSVVFRLFHIAKLIILNNIKIATIIYHYKQHF